jgi:hypothetical protein
MTRMQARQVRAGRGRGEGEGTGLGVEFDVYWLSPDKMERQVIDAGFAAVFRGGRPAEGAGGFPAGISTCLEILKSALCERPHFGIL